MGEAPVGHPPLDAEAAPRCSSARLAGGRSRAWLTPSRSRTVSSCLARKMLAAVGHQPLGRAVLLDRHEEDHQEGAEVLRARQAAGDDGARVVVEDRDRVDLEVAQAVVEVADVGRPVLVASRRLEGHRLGLAGDRLRLGQAVELAVEGQDAPAGARAEEDARAA